MFENILMIIIGVGKFGRSFLWKWRYVQLMHVGYSLFVKTGTSDRTDGLAVCQRNAQF